MMARWRTVLWAVLLGLAQVAAMAQQSPLLNDLRQNIGEVFINDSLCYRFEKRVMKADVSHDNTLLGYKGAVWMAKARHAANPMHKLSYFNEGKGWLEAALANEPDNVELRFLRLTIQVNVPGILGYSDKKKSDLAFVESRIPTLKIPELRTRMTNFIAKAREQGKL